MSNEIYEKLEICRKSILQKTNFKPEVAVILGSRWNRSFHIQKLKVFRCRQLWDIKDNLYLVM